jgi:hypothetical protein
VQNVAAMLALEAVVRTKLLAICGIMADNVHTVCELHNILVCLQEVLSAIKSCKGFLNTMAK